MNLNDAIHSALGEGHINDLLLAYYQENGAESDNIADAMYEFLLVSGATAAQVNDMWFEVLRSAGYSGLLSDMKYDFWSTGGILFLEMVSGTVNNMVVTVDFNKEVYFTELTIPNGITITNTTTTEVAVITLSNKVETDQAEYTVTWLVIPDIGDEFTISYDGNGDYVDTNNVSMSAQEISA